MPILSVDENLKNGGFCPNITDYCHFGCCGDHDVQHCCFPIGVFIGCGIGVLGTIFLLISLFRCRLSRSRNQPQSQNTNDMNFALGPEYGRENQAYSSECSTIHSVTGSQNYPKYSDYHPPPSYEAVMAETEGRIIENNIT